MELEKADNQSSLVQTQLMDLVLPTLSVAIRRIRDYGIEAAPEEACGVLVNEMDGVRVVQMLNRAEDRTSGYRIDPAMLRQLSMKPKSWAHVAIWHTHPGGNVGPSPGDLEHKIHGVQYLVVTVPTGEATWF